MNVLAEELHRRVHEEREGEGRNDRGKGPSVLRPLIELRREGRVAQVLPAHETSSSSDAASDLSGASKAPRNKSGFRFVVAINGFWKR